MLLFLKDTLSIKDDKLLKTSRSVFSNVPWNHKKRDTPIQTVKISTLFSQKNGFLSYLAQMYYATSRFPYVSIRLGSLLIIMSTPLGAGHIIFAFSAVLSYLYQIWHAGLLG